MIQIVVSKNQILELVELGKAIKQKNFMYFNGMIVGMDFPQSCLIYTHTSFLNTDIYGFIFNYKDLSSCAKLLVGDDNVVFYSIDSVNFIGGPVRIECIRNMNSCATIHKIMMDNNDICKMVDQPVEITDKMQELFSLRKGDGAYRFIYDGLCMTLFSGILPLRKNDKVYLSIFMDTPTTFKAKFTVKQAKNIQVYVILRYLRI